MTACSFIINPMTTLLLDAPARLRVPANGVPANDAPASEPIASADVLASSFVDALLAHGSYDAYYFLGGNERTLSEPDVHDHGAADRIRVIGRDHFEELRHLPRPVMAGVGWHPLPEHRLLRQLYSRTRDWPLTGCIHSTQAKAPLALLLQLVLGDVQPWDALICSSRAGRQVIERYLATLTEAYPGLRKLDWQEAISLSVIPFGTDAIDADEARRAKMRQQLGAAADDVVFVYVGRWSLVSKCDLIPLVAAFAGMRPDLRARSRLVLAGDDVRDRLHDTFARVASELGCADRVVLHANPTASEKLDLYRAADVFVSPGDNLQETFGLAITEALSVGLPVIASDWNGYRDLVDEGVTGFLVPTYWTDLGPSFEDMSICSGVENDGTLSGATIVDVGRLRHVMERLASDADGRAAMSRRARQAFAARFAWPVIIQQYEALWNELRARATCDAAGNIRRPAQANGLLRQTFGHYPSGWLQDDCEVALGGLSDQLEPLLASARDMPVPCPSSFDTIARLAIHELTASPRMSLGELLTCVCLGTYADVLTIRLAVARLMKYDLVRPVGTSTLLS